MKILLLGSAGNLGSALTQAAEATENTLIAWDKEEIDVTDEGLLRKKIIELAPDAVINAVAYNNVDACETDEAARELAEKLNVELVHNLAAIALETNAILIHYSSDYVFNGEEAAGYEENAEPDPQSAYAKSKLGGEKELITLSGKGLKWYLIRTSKLFGPKGASALAKPSFFELMLKRAESGETLSVVSDEQGSFTYTKDLAQATLSLLEGDYAFGIYHAVNSGTASWFDAASYFFKKLGKEINIKAVSASDFPRPAPRPKYSLLLNTKLPALRSWQEAIDDYILTL